MCRVEPFEVCKVEGSWRGVQGSSSHRAFVARCPVVALSPDSLLSRLELSDTNVCEPEIRARLGTAAYLCTA